MYIDTPIANPVPAQPIRDSLLEAIYKLQNATIDELEYVRDYLIEADKHLWSACEDIENLR